MDTIENIEPAGSDGATSSPDTSATPDTQPVESPDVVSANEGGEAGAPENLLAGKYKSPEDLEKAYKELEGKLGGLGRKAAVADLIQEKYGMSPEQLRATIEAEEQARLEHEYATNPAGYALKEVQSLKEELALKEEEGKLNAFIAENPDYAPFKDKLFNLYLNVEKDKDLGEIAVDYFGTAIAKGQESAYKKIDTKKMTQATGVSQTAPKQKLTLEDMQKMSSKDLEAVLPWADISYRP